MRRIIFMVVSAALIATMVIGGPAAAQEYKSKGERGVSPTVRNDKSGQSNFGECHKPAFRDIIESEGYGGSGEFSRNYNPSPKSSGYAECKEVEGRTFRAELFGAADECLPDNPYGDRCVVGEISWVGEPPPTEPPGQRPLPDDDPCREDPTLCEDVDPCEEDPTLCVDPCEEDPTLPGCVIKTASGGEEPVEFATLGFIAPMLVGGCLLAYRTIRSR